MILYLTFGVIFGVIGAIIFSYIAAKDNIRMYKSDYSVSIVLPVVVLVSTTVFWPVVVTVGVFGGMMWYIRGKIISKLEVKK